MVQMTKDIRRLFCIVSRNSLQYFKKAGLWGVAEQVTAVFRALLWTIGIIVSHQLFDSITDSIGTQNGFNAVANYVITLILVVVAQQIASGLGQYLFSKVSYTNMGKFMSDFQKKLGRLPAILFEDPHFLDRIDKAKECLEYESLGHFASVCIQMITYYLIYLISVGGYLFSLSPFLLLIIFLSFIPAVIGQIIKAKNYVNLEDDIAPLRHQSDYYKKTITDIGFFKETRLLGAYSFFYNYFVSSLSLVIKKRWEIEKKMAVVQIGLGCISFIGLGLSILVLFRTTMDGTISIGAFTAVFIAISDVFSIIDELVSSHLGEASEVFAQVLNFYDVMDMDEAKESIKLPDFSNGVIAKEACFFYPGSCKPAINNVSLEIKDGETIALVGENGSGKTTLVRLLTGLYVPSSGEIRIGGICNIKETRGLMHTGISGVFQNYQRYKMTLADNVSISEPSQPPMIDKIKKALDNASFNTSIVDITQTILSPEFDGIDLSGGQWQRVAIARGLFRKSDFIVLDEPTAAIDPVEESLVFKRFKEIARGRTSIIVTHRLGSARFADRILVMENGQIVEEGTHAVLVERNGKYAKMWESQASWYNN